MLNNLSPDYVKYIYWKILILIDLFLDLCLLWAYFICFLVKRKSTQLVQKRAQMAQSWDRYRSR